MAVSQTHAERAEAIRSLLPLLERELEGPEPAGGGVLPLGCDGRCVGCRERCADVPLLRIWRQLRAAYPQLLGLERLLNELVTVKAHWASALYWVYVQPWDDFHRERRAEYAAAGVDWLACEWEARGLGWLPTYEQGLRPMYSRDGEIERLLERGCTWRKIAKETGCSFRDVARVSRARAVRSERAT